MPCRRDHSWNARNGLGRRVCAPALRQRWIESISVLNAPAPGWGAPAVGTQRLAPGRPGAEHDPVQMGLAVAEGDVGAAAAAQRLERVGRPLLAPREFCLEAAETVLYRRADERPPVGEAAVHRRRGDLRFGRDGPDRQPFGVTVGCQHPHRSLDQLAAQPLAGAGGIARAGRARVAVGGHAAEGSSGRARRNS